MDFAPNEFGLQRPSANGRPAPTEKMPSASAEADAWRGAPGEADFNRRGRLWPTVGLARRMNSASRGLRPMVGLRRPKKCLLRRRRPTPGAERLGRPISIGVGAFGRRSACTPNEFGLQRPSANGRPAPTAKMPLLRRRRPTPGAERLERPISIGVRAFGRWSAWGRRMNSASRGLRPAVGLRRPENASLRRRRPTPGAERPWRPISIGVKACADREGVLRRRRPTLGA
jgi:hypothetical protein